MMKTTTSDLSIVPSATGIRHGCTVWGLNDIRPGTEAQVSGVAEKMHLPADAPFIVKKPTYTRAIRWPNIWPGLGVRIRKTELVAPWPDVAICSGRRAARALHYIKWRNPDTLTVRLTKPKDSPDRYDLLVFPTHDALPEKLARQLRRTRCEIIRHVFAPHRLTDAKYAAARDIWQPHFKEGDKRLVSVLVGGASKHAPFDVADAHTHMQHIRRAFPDAKLLVTTSRRSGLAVEEAVAQYIKPGDYYYRASLKDDPAQGDNPYLGLLACADAIVATADSVSMVSEAVFSRNPVYLVHSRDISGKYVNFSAQAVALGVAQMLPQEPVGALFVPNPATLDDPDIMDVAQLVANRIHAMLAMRRKQPPVGLLRGWLRFVGLPV